MLKVELVHFFRLFGYFFEESLFEFREGGLQHNQLLGVLPLNL
jgi:hypothetical protein